VTESPCVQLSFESSDRLLELKMAIWETQLQDLYPTAQIICTYDHVFNQGRVTIQFQSGDDHVHWCLSQPEYHKLNHLLTYQVPMLNCVYEKEFGNIRFD